MSDSVEDDHTEINLEYRLHLCIECFICEEKCGNVENVSVKSNVMAKY